MRPNPKICLFPIKRKSTKFMFPIRPKFMKKFAVIIICTGRLLLPDDLAAIFLNKQNDYLSSWKIIAIKTTLNNACCVLKPCLNKNRIDKTVGA